MRIRLREPAGQTTLSFPDSATVEDLQKKIAEQTSLAAFDVKYGYPPKLLVLADYPQTAKLSVVGIKLDGEQLIVSRKYQEAYEPASVRTEIPPPVQTANADMSSSTMPQKAPTATPSSNFSFAGVGTAPPQPPAESSKPLSLNRKQPSMEMDAPEFPVPTHGATMILRIMPDDNSCLFRAFNSAFLGTMDNMHELRSIIAQTIQSNLDTYPEVVLDQKPDDYCRWIQTQDAWGGSIELDILSKHFEVEICSIDVQTLRVDKYNEGVPTRCILVYSGIHYDTIALSPSDPPHEQAYAPPEFDTKVFDTLDDVVLQAAVELCNVLQGRHYFTDTAGFTVRCNICGFSAKGEKGATQHASETGHMDFGEA